MRKRQIREGEGNRTNQVIVVAQAHLLRFQEVFAHPKIGLLHHP